MDKAAFQTEIRRTSVLQLSTEERLQLVKQNEFGIAFYSEPSEDLRYHEWFGDVEILLSIGYTMSQIVFLCPFSGDDYLTDKGSREYCRQIVNELQSNFDKRQKELEMKLRRETRAQCRAKREEAQKQQEHLDLIIETRAENPKSEVYVFDAEFAPMSKLPFYEFPRVVEPINRVKLKKLRDLFPLVCKGSFDVIVLRDGFVQFVQFLYNRGWFLYEDRTNCSFEHSAKRLVMAMAYDVVPGYLFKGKQYKIEITRHRTIGYWLENFKTLSKVFCGKKMMSSQLIRRINLASSHEFYSKTIDDKYKRNPRKMNFYEGDYEDSPEYLNRRARKNNFRREVKEFRSKNSRKTDEEIDGEMWQEFNKHPDALLLECVANVNRLVDAVTKIKLDPSFVEHQRNDDLEKIRFDIYTWRQKYVLRYRQVNTERMLKITDYILDLKFRQTVDQKTEIAIIGEMLIEPVGSGRYEDLRNSHLMLHYEIEAWRRRYSAIRKHVDHLAEKDTMAYNTWYDIANISYENLQREIRVCYRAQEIIEAQMMNTNRMSTWRENNPPPYISDDEIPFIDRANVGYMLGRATEKMGYEMKATAAEIAPQVAKDIFSTLTEMFSSSVKSFFADIPSALGNALDSFVGYIDSDVVANLVAYLKEVYGKIQDEVTRIWSSLTGDNTKDRNLVPHILTWLVIGCVLVLVYKVFSLSVDLLRIGTLRFIKEVLGDRYMFDMSWGLDYFVRGITYDAMHDDLNFSGSKEAFQNSSVEINGQGFGLGISSVVGVVALVLALFDPKGLSAANGVMNLITKTGPFADDVKTQLTDAIDNLWISLTDGERGHLFSTKAEVSAYLEYIKKIQTFAGTPNLREKAFKEPIVTKELEDLVTKGAQMKIMLKDMQSPLLGPFSRTFSFLRDLHHECLSNADMYQNRIETVCCWFYGAAKAGKNRALDMLPMDVYCDLREALSEIVIEDGKEVRKDVLPPWSAGQVFTRAKGSDFWDTYIGQWVTAFPEVLTANDAAECRLEMNEVLNICQEAVMSLNVAFQDKGKCFMRSDLLTITTNANYQELAFGRGNEIGIRNPEAVVRRLTFPLKVVRKENLEDNYSNLDTTWSFELHWPKPECEREFFIGISRFLEASPAEGKFAQGKRYKEFCAKKVLRYPYSAVKRALGLELYWRRMRPRDKDRFPLYRKPVDLKEEFAKQKDHFICPRRSNMSVDELEKEDVESFKENYLAISSIQENVYRTMGYISDPIEDKKRIIAESEALAAVLNDTSSLSEWGALENTPEVQSPKTSSSDPDEIIGEMLKSISELASELWRDVKDTPKMSVVNIEREREEERKGRELERQRLKANSTIFKYDLSPSFQGLLTSPANVMRNEPVSYVPRLDGSGRHLETPMSNDETEGVAELLNKAKEVNNWCVENNCFESLCTPLDWLWSQKEFADIDRVRIGYLLVRCSCPAGPFSYTDQFMVSAPYENVRTLIRLLCKWFKRFEVGTTQEQRNKKIATILKLSGYSYELTEIFGYFHGEFINVDRFRTFAFKNYDGYVPSMPTCYILYLMSALYHGVWPSDMHGTITLPLKIFSESYESRSNFSVVANCLLKTTDYPKTEIFEKEEKDILPNEEIDFDFNNWKDSIFSSLYSLKEKMMEFPIFGYCLMGSAIVAAITTAVWCTFADDDPADDPDYCGEMMHSGTPPYSSESITKRDGFKTSKFVPNSNVKKDPFVTSKFVPNSNVKKDPFVTSKYKPNHKNPEKIQGVRAFGNSIIGEHFQLTGDGAIEAATARITACIRNCREARFYYPGMPVPAWTRLFAIDGYTYMNTAHFFEAYGTAFTKVEFLGIGGVVTSAYDNTQVKIVTLNDLDRCDIPNKREIFSFGTRDVSLLYFKMNTTEKSLVKHLPSHSTIFPEEGITKIKPVVTPTSTHIYLPYSKQISVFANKAVPVKVNFVEGKKLSFSHAGAVFGCRGVAGDCALPYVDVYTQNSIQWLLGFHIGSGGANGYFAPVYREDFKYLWNWKKNCYVARSAIDLRLDDCEAHSYFDPVSVYFPAKAEKLFQFQGSVSSEDPNIYCSEGVKVDGLPDQKSNNVKGTYYFGTMKKNNFIPSQTQFVPSLFQGCEDTGDPPIFPIESAPAQLSTFLDSNDKIVSPLLLAKEKISAVDKSNPIPGFVQYYMENDPEFLAEGFLPEKWVQRPKFRRMKIREACFGIAGIFSSVDISTAAGFWLWISCMTRKDIIDKDRIDPKSGEKGWISPLLYQEIGRIENAVAKGHIPKLVTLGCLKDELRDLDRVNKGKTRLFHVGDFAHMIWTKMVIGHAVEWIKANRFATCGAIGTNPHGPDWAQWLRILKSLDGDLLFGGGDFSGYDTGIKQPFGKALGFLLNTLYCYSEGSYLYRELLYCCIATVGPLMIIGRTGYFMDYMNPSGGWATGFLNTFVNACILKVVFLVLCKECKSHGCDCDLKDKINMSEVTRKILYGDDNIWSVLKEYGHHWNMQNIARILKDTFGMLYTRPDKTDVGGEGFIPLSELDFLCRRFHGSEFYAKAPLGMDSIRGMLLWIRDAGHGNSDDPENIAQLEQNIDTAMMEMFYYGRAAFDEVALKVQQYCRDYNVKYTGQSFEAYQLRHTSAYQ